MPVRDPKPKAVTYRPNRSGPSRWATDAAAMLLLRSSAWVIVMRPFALRSQFRIVNPPRVRMPVSSITVSGVTTRSSMPAAMVTILKVDPGS